MTGELDYVTRSKEPLALTPLEIETNKRLERIGAIKREDLQYALRIQTGNYVIDEKNPNEIPPNASNLNPSEAQKIHTRSSKNEREKIFNEMKSGTRRILPDIQQEIFDKYNITSTQELTYEMNIEIWKRKFEKTINQLRANITEESTKQRLALVCGQTPENFAQQAFTADNADTFRLRFFDTNGKEKIGNDDTTFFESLENGIYTDKNQIVNLIKQDEGWISKLAMNLYGDNEGRNRVAKFFYEMSEKYGSSEAKDEFNRKKASGTFEDMIEAVNDIQKDGLDQLQAAKDQIANEANPASSVPDSTPPPIPEGQDPEENEVQNKQERFAEVRRRIFTDLPQSELALSGLNTDEALIKQQWQNIENIHPDPLERLQFLYTILLGRGLDIKAAETLGNKSTEEMLTAILSSEEHQNKRVQAENVITLYQEIFDNPPTIEKKQEYMAGLMLGQTYAELREELIQSNEFKRKTETQPGDREAKLKIIYRSLFGREITDDDKQHHTNTQSTEEIIHQILASDAYKEKRIIEQEVIRMINSTLYSGLDFDCEPDIKTVNEILKKLQFANIEMLGKSRDEIAQALIQSAGIVKAELATKDPYKQKAEQLQTKRTNWQHIAHDQAELNNKFNTELDYWKDQVLESGKSFLEHRETLNRNDFAVVVIDNLLVFFPKAGTDAETSQRRASIQKEYGSISCQIDYNTGSRLREKKLTTVFLLPETHCKIPGSKIEGGSIIINYNNQNAIDDFAHEEVHASLGHTRGGSTSLEAAEGAALNFARLASKNPNDPNNVNRADKYMGREELVKKILADGVIVLSSTQIASQTELEKIQREKKINDRALYGKSYIIGDMLFYIMAKHYGIQKAKNMFLYYYDQSRRRDLTFKGDQREEINIIQDGHLTHEDTEVGLRLNKHVLISLGITDEAEIREAEKAYINGVTIPDYQGNLSEIKVS